MQSAYAWPALACKLRTASFDYGEYKANEVKELLVAF